MRALPTYLLVLSAACGARATVVSSNDAGDSGLPDGLSDAGPDAQVTGCPLSWAACEARAGVVDVADRRAAAFDVGWDGQQLLVAYGDGVDDAALAHVDLDGLVTGETSIGATGWARLTWNPRLRSGLVVLTTEIQWLGSDGWPTGVPVPTGIRSHRVFPDAIATAGGFLLLSGTWEGGDDTPPPLHYAVLGGRPSELTWERLADGARAAAEHANDQEGLGLWGVSTVYWENEGEVYRFDSALDPPEQVFELHDLPPDQLTGHASGIAERRGLLYVLYTGADWNGAPTQTVLEIGGTGDARAWPIHRFTAYASGHLLTLGDTLVIASDVISDEGVASLAAFDPDAEPPLGPVWQLAASGVYSSAAPRLARTSTGFAAVWTEHGGGEDMAAKLMIFDCCAAN